MVFSTPQWVSGQFWCGFVVSIHKPGSATLDGFKLHAWGFQHWLNQGLITLCFDSFMISSKVALHESQYIIYHWTVFGTCACSRRASLCLGPQQGFDIIGRQIDSQIYMRANVLVILHLLKLFPMYVIWSVDRVLFYCDSDDLTFAGVDQHEPTVCQCIFASSM